ncbi:Homologous-pairing protein 2-like protein [Ooceraea biroi]|nr:Homologous-pairing protein 2-like protein [Ooceraea biroi]
MKTQNRPYSVNDLVTSLHTYKYSKPEVQQVMNQLVTDGKLFVKVYGNQKIYCAVQHLTCNTDELVRIDKELQTHAYDIERKYQEVINRIKEQEALLICLKSSLSLKQAKEEEVVLLDSVIKLKHELDEQNMTKNRIEDLRQSKRKAQEQVDEYSREYFKRKRICTEIIDTILENYPGTKDQLYDEAGIESMSI